MNEEWDESFVLVFPLEKSNEFRRYDRYEIETAVGKRAKQQESLNFQGFLLLKSDAEKGT